MSDTKPIDYGDMDVYGDLPVHAPTPILCPDCGHDIDCHALHEPCSDCWQTAAFDGAVDPCQQQPSDIARALLAAEPTDAKVAAAARAVWESIPGITPRAAEKAALAALRAAREPR